MKYIQVSLLASALLFSNMASAQTETIDGYEVVADIAVVRPLSFVGMVVGTAIFVALSPATALATIPAPHKAFQQMADTLIIDPAKFAFTRPAGDFNHDSGPAKTKRNPG